MCGIGLLVSGIHFDLSSLFPSGAPPIPKPHQEVEISVEDLEVVLHRRGPDSLGTRKVFLHSKVSTSDGAHELLCIMEQSKEMNGDGSGRNKFDCIDAVIGGTIKPQNGFSIPKSVPELHFIGSTLQLRGVNPIFQPLVDDYENILLYNGEIFGGVPVGFSSNDAEILLHALRNCCSCDSSVACHCARRGKRSVPELLSVIKGPWAVVYWQKSTSTLWFGRDAFGRRSLLVHWPTSQDSRLLLSSVSTPSLPNWDNDVELGMGNLFFWEELPCGVYSLHVRSSKLVGCLSGEVKKHEWTNSMLRELIKWERNSVEPKPEELQLFCNSTPAQRVLNALREAVIRRSIKHAIFQEPKAREVEHVPVAILFSGGLDSMILAALLNECLEPCYGIDLLNVSFDGQFAPDRISSRAGIMELKRIAPLRRWKLVEIDADLSKLTLETKHVMSLITPANTYMDLNIGVALYLAASGDGLVSERFASNKYEDEQRVNYKSEARILLVGSGADEQCGGYGRHKTKYRQEGWVGLHEEMQLDMQRIWKRNMGRDDRCISDNGKEARFPFLDEDVIRTLLDLPLWDVADLDQPSGTGDKKILRQVAQLLMLKDVGRMPKRAIQFGSRIARESNRKNFGSNRAANQASAGSAVIHTPPT